MITVLVVAGVLGTAATAMAVNADTFVSPNGLPVVSTDAPTPDPSVTSDPSVTPAPDPSVTPAPDPSVAPAQDDDVSGDAGANTVASHEANETNESGEANDSSEHAGVNGATVSAFHESPRADASHPDATSTTAPQGDSDTDR